MGGTEKVFGVNMYMHISTRQQLCKGRTGNASEHMLLMHDQTGKCNNGSNSSFKSCALKCTKTFHTASNILPKS